jgi:hypothetical protein
MLAKTPSAMSSALTTKNNHHNPPSPPIIHLDDHHLYEIYDHPIRKAISIMEYSTNLVKRMQYRYEQYHDTYLRTNHFHWNSILHCYQDYFKNVHSSHHQDQDHHHQEEEFETERLLLSSSSPSSSSNGMLQRSHS